MRVTPSLLFAALLAGGCSSEAVPDALNLQAKRQQEAAHRQAADARAVQAGFAPAQPAAIETVSVDPPRAHAPGVMLPPASAQYRYIGHWAASAAACADTGWQFRSRGLSTGGETDCDFPTVAAVRSGYELRGECRSDGRKVAETLKLDFDERGRRMRVEGRLLGPADLLYCGD